MSCELLQEAHTAITDLTEAYNDWYKAANGDEPTEQNPHRDVLVKLEAELARTEWVKFTDALPVVPEGKFSVHIWCWRDGQKGKPYTSNFWAVGFERHTSAATHWMYRQDDTPAPPRSES